MEQMNPSTMEKRTNVKPEKNSKIFAEKILDRVRIIKFALENLWTLKRAIFAKKTTTNTPYTIDNTKRSAYSRGKIEAEL